MINDGSSAWRAVAKAKLSDITAHLGEEAPLSLLALFAVHLLSGAMGLFQLSAIRPGEGEF